MMRVNVVIDDDLMRQAMETSGLPTKRAVIEEALRAYLRIRVQGQRRLFELAGQIEFDPDWDYKAMREAR